MGMQRDSHGMVCQFFQIGRNRPQLTLLVFLEAFAEYYELLDIPPECKGDRTEPWFRIATDNQGLIDRIQQALETKTKFAGAGLSPEYDVVNEIVEITRRLPFPLTWEHVKGHQDDRKKWYELTWMETLNVRADKNATIGLNAALEVTTNPARTIHIIPSSQVGLHIHGTDITSHYATHLRKAATKPAMLSHMEKTFGWTNSQFDMIDWKAHHGALQKLKFHENKFITKFIHQSLPMGAVYHKMTNPSQASATHATPIPKRHNTYTAAPPGEQEWKTYS
jgi:hypothetical protein